MARGTGSTAFMVVFGGILGGYVGELLGWIVPTGVLHTLFTKGFPLGLDTPIVLNLSIIVLTFGFKIFLNIFGVVGMILGLYYSK